MNWGLFLGCRVRYFGVKKEDFILDGVFKKDNNTMLQVKNKDYSVYDYDCKPVLRPLSSMTDDEHAYFIKLFCLLQVFKPRLLFDNIVYVNFGTAGTTQQIIWLMQKGFYVGQCEEGEYILDEVTNDNTNTIKEVM